MASISKGDFSLYSLPGVVNYMVATYATRTSGSSYPGVSLAMHPKGPSQEVSSAILPNSSFSFILQHLYPVWALGLARAGGGCGVSLFGPSST